MRSWIAVLLVSLGACSPEPLCGEDEAGEAIPICTYEIDGTEFEYCPNEHWADTECRSCSCTPAGEIVCTEPQTPCE